MEYFIRRAELKDIDYLSDLFHDFIGKDSNKYNMKEQLKTINENSNYFVAVADDGNKVVGTAMAIICYDLVGECGTFMLVENVVVAPDYVKAHMNFIKPLDIPLTRKDLKRN
jgi:N-acetylglutamate synthase-like GNAT family acetyltransferase